MPTWTGASNRSLQVIEYQRKNVAAETRAKMPTPNLMGVRIGLKGYHVANCGVKFSHEGDTILVLVSCQPAISFPWLVAAKLFCVRKFEGGWFSRPFRTL